jgi:hypothetical protein
VLGGADIDDLLDDDDDLPASQRKPEPKGDKGNSTGVKIGRDHRSHETPPSKLSKEFRALTEPERADFVKFAWSMLRPAIETCITAGRVEWPMAGVQAEPGNAALADVAGALAKAAKVTKAAAPAPAVAVKKAKQPAKPPAKPAPRKGKRAATAEV